MVSALNGAVSLVEVDDITIFIACGERRGQREKQVRRNKDNYKIISSMKRRVV